MAHPLPDAALTHHTAVVGKTGSGKSSTARLIVEHVVEHGARVCILDPIKSDWWGITSSADGKRPGLPFVILGGPRGHVPLHEGAGKAIGDLVGAGQLPLSIIDMSDFRPGGLQRFFVDFAEALFKRLRGVVYLVVEEAHEFAPKERAGLRDENYAIHWAKKLAAAGRSKGIRLIVVTQRTQSLHNAVLGSCETLIAHRMTLPADQKPIVDWLRANVDKATVERIASSLASLRTGSGWICSGEAKIADLVQFPRFATYDNTATPTGDDHDHAVQTAPVDRERLRAIIGDAVREAEANDPKALKGRIAELERELAKRAPTVDTQAVADAEQRAFIKGYGQGFGNAADLALGVLLNIQDTASRALESLRRQRDEATSRQPAPSPVQTARNHPDPSPAPRPTETVRYKASAGAGAKMSKAERLILTAIAQYPQGRSKVQVAILTGYAVNGGGFNNALSALRTKGWIQGDVNRLSITPAGLEALGPYDPLPTGRALLEHWLGQLDKAPRLILEALAKVYPRAMSKEQLASATGYEASGGGFNNALGRLRTLELITRGAEIRASDTLFGEG